MLRKGNENDAGKIKDVVIEAWESMGDRTIRGRFTEKTVLDFLKKEYNQIFVWEEKNKIVGITMNHIDEKHPNVGYISTIGVKTNYRGRGIASRLIQKSEEEFRKRGVKKVFIRTYSNNISAQVTYLKNGYLVEGVIRNYVKEGVHWIWFGKDI